MGQILLNKKYYGDENYDMQGDIEDSILEINDQNEIDEWGDFKGYLRVTVEYIKEGGCECKGFQHHPDCPNWVMSF